jgi:hypothetical protein
MFTPLENPRHRLTEGRDPDGERGQTARVFAGVDPHRLTSSRPSGRDITLVITHHDTLMSIESERVHGLIEQSRFRLATATLGVVIMWAYVDAV